MVARARGAVIEVARPFHRRRRSEGIADPSTPEPYTPNLDGSGGPGHHLGCRAPCAVAERLRRHRRRGIPRVKLQSLACPSPLSALPPPRVTARIHEFKHKPATHPRGGRPGATRGGRRPPAARAEAAGPSSGGERPLDPRPVAATLRARGKTVDVLRVEREEGLALAVDRVVEGTPSRRRRSSRWTSGTLGPPSP